MPSTTLQSCNLPETIANYPSPSRQSRKTVLLHSEVFRERLYPEITAERSNWDNLSGDIHSPSIDTWEDCQALCASVPACLQYSWRGKRCFTNKSPRLGQGHADARSGWVVRRINGLVAAAPKCKKPDFGL